MKIVRQDAKNAKTEPRITQEERSRAFPVPDPPDFLSLGSVLAFLASSGGPVLLLPPGAFLACWRTAVLWWGSAPASGALVNDGEDGHENAQAGEHGPGRGSAGVWRQRLLRLDCGRIDVVPPAGCIRRGGSSTWSTPPTFTHGGSPATRAGRPRRSSGKWLKQSGKARQDRPRHQGGHGDGAFGKGPVAGVHLPGGGAVAPAAPDRYHRPCKQRTRTMKRRRLEETLGAFAELIRQGKVRAIGASNYSRLGGWPRSLQVSKAHGLPAYQVPPAALQPLRRASLRARTGAGLPGSGARRDPLLLAGERLPLGKIPLGSGPCRKSARVRGSRIYLNERGFRILDALDEVAGRYGANPTQVALAWLLARPSVTAPIASATSVAQLDDLIAGTRLELDRAALELLDHASA